MAIVKRWGILQVLIYKKRLAGQYAPSQVSFKEKLWLYFGYSSSFGFNTDVIIRRSIMVRIVMSFLFPFWMFAEFLGALDQWSPFNLVHSLSASVILSFLASAMIWAVITILLDVAFSRVYFRRIRGGEQNAMYKDDGA